jgi:hypothetical protein
MTLAAALDRLTEEIRSRRVRKTYSGSVPVEGKPVGHEY